MLVIGGWPLEEHALEASLEEVMTTHSVAVATGEAAGTSDSGREIPLSSREASRRILEEIMAGDEFHQKSTLRVPEFMRSWFEPEASEKPESKPDLPWLKTLMSFLASFLEMLLWLVLAALVIYLGYRFRLWDFSRIPRAQREQTRPEILMGLDLSVEAMPQDTLAAASDAWRQGHSRLAISQLYRGALVRLMDDYDCRFYEGDTEALCLEEARRKAVPETSAYFESLTYCWQQLAYGHQVLHTDQFNRLIGDWNKVWQNSGHG